MSPGSGTTGPFILILRTIVLFVLQPQNASSTRMPHASKPQYHCSSTSAGAAMARFTVPSSSPPSTPGSQKSSESASTVNTSGPTAFRVPSASSSSACSRHSPSHSPRNGGIPGGFFESASPSDSQASVSPNRRKRSKSPSAESPAPQRPRYNFRPARPIVSQNDGERTPQPVPTFFDAGEPAANSPSSTNESESERDGENEDPDMPHSPSDDTDTDLSNQDLWMPLVGHQPESRPGRFGAAQPAPARHLTLLKERPGVLPAHTARSPTSPGFDWGDGATWWHPAGSNGSKTIVREIFTPTGFKVIGQDVAQATAELMYHDNLVNMLDGDGFRSEQRGVRPEVLYEFCQGGTLNKLILSRRPEVPMLKPRRPATYLPTRDVVLALPEDLVWHVLLSLLRATHWLHHRRQPIVHCAVDPANVFFTAPNLKDRRPLVRRYGLVKLGNVSRAVILPHRLDPGRDNDDEILDRCSMFEHMITESYEETGYEAPELLGMLGEDEISEEKVFPGPCSDLFSIGVTCFAMMTGRTLWDLLLESRFITRSNEPHTMDGAILEEKWRFSEFDERMEMLETVLRGEQVLGDALPGLYSVELRSFVKGLLSLDPDVRGESAALLDEAEETIAEKCAEANGDGLEEMRRAWRAATGQPTAREELESAIEREEQFRPTVRPR